MKAGSALATAPDMHPAHRLPRLMLVSDRHRGHGTTAVAPAIAGGLRFVQIREKDLPAAAIAAQISALRAHLGNTQTEVLISVNGRPTLARELGVGLHLPADHPVVQRSGIHLIGRSAHGSAEVDRALHEGADYLVVGTLFATPSKPGRTPLGLDAFETLVRRAHPTPVYAIGGIDAARVGDVIAAGGHGVAVCGALLQAPDPAETAAAFMRALADADADLQEPL